MINLINLQRHIESGGFFGSDSAQTPIENDFCTCTQGKGLDFGENGQYCIDCGKYTFNSYTGNLPIPVSSTGTHKMQLDNFHKVVAETPQSVKDEVIANLIELDNKNALEKLEQWIEDNWPEQHMIIYPKSELLAKIQSLKPQ